MAKKNGSDDRAPHPGKTFELADVYAVEDRLADQYSNNQHIKTKIRQQLQVLRDEGLLAFLGNGEDRLRWVDRREDTE